MRGDKWLDDLKRRIGAMHERPLKRIVANIGVDFLVDEARHANMIVVV